MRLVSPLTKLEFVFLVIGMLSTSLMFSQIEKKKKITHGFTVMCKKDIEYAVTIHGLKKKDYTNSDAIIIELINTSLGISPIVLKKFTKNDILNKKIETKVTPQGDIFGAGFQLQVRINDTVFATSNKTFFIYNMTGLNLDFDQKDEVLSICKSGDSVELSVNVVNVVEDKYEWYKNGIKYKDTTKPKLEVTEPGEYQMKMDYGICHYYQTNRITVAGAGEISINGGDKIEICPDEFHEFKASTKSAGGTYQWYKDGEKIKGATKLTYKTSPNTDQFGKYVVEITIAGCDSVKSKEVELVSKTGTDISVKNNFEGVKIVLPNETHRLEVSVTPVSEVSGVQWYKDGQALPGKTAYEIDVTTLGSYFAKVHFKAAGVCNRFYIDSEKFDLLAVKSLKPLIKATSDPTDCKSENTKLFLEDVKAIASNGEEYELTAAQKDKITYQWYKNDQLLVSQTAKELALASYSDNGIYQLKVMIAGVEDGYSNSIEAQLRIANPTITPSGDPLYLCPDKPLILKVSEIIEGFTYRWFKGADEVIVKDPQKITIVEAGDYRLEISGVGACEAKFPPIPIHVVAFDDEGITVSPSEKVVLIEGETRTITADGASTYAWYNEDEELLSEAKTLEVDELGTYILIAKANGGCEIRKKIEVVAQDEQIIVPNVVSPNGDSINDTWQLSNKYAFQPEVTIIIYNANGREVFKTTDYKNDWPMGDMLNQRIFYYKILRKDSLIKSGTISILR